MYLSANEHFKGRFGCKVYRLSLDGGFTCPNRDGRIGTGGCIFCTGSAEFAAGGRDIPGQLERARDLVAAKNRGGKYLAYFQAFTNTYAPVEQLEKLYRQAMEPEDVVGIAVGTRPDCLGPEVLELLGRLNREKAVYVELGLQTCDDSVARYIRRGYETAVYDRAVEALGSLGIHVITHIILGLPGDDPVATTRHAVAAGTHGIKFHLLHILENTDLAREYRQGRVTCLSMEEYGALLKDCLAQVPPQVVIHRLTGDGAKRSLIAPMWSADKKRVLNYLRSIL